MRQHRTGSNTVPYAGLGRHSGNKGIVKVFKAVCKSAEFQQEFHPGRCVVYKTPLFLAGGGKYWKYLPAVYF